MDEALMTLPILAGVIEHGMNPTPDPRIVVCVGCGFIHAAHRNGISNADSRSVTHPHPAS
jgi:hypothetical protein